VALTLSPQVFIILRALIEEKTGIHYSDHDRELLAERISVRAEEAAFDSLLDYYYFLRYDPEGKRELSALVETLVVNETYFFRELVPLTVLVDAYLAPAIAAGRRPRVWCAAAATGEEPLTLAMLLARRSLLDQVEILASDISERALDQARRGQYGRRSLRNLPPGYERWLRVEGERATVAPELIERIRWRRINLIDRVELPPAGFDAILCRNVLIYFSRETAAQVVENLSARLTPEGVLLVGISESLLGLGTLLRCEERGGAFFYEKVTPP
jgi:chemotaxis protein methyltransferase CheR